MKVADDPVTVQLLFEPSGRPVDEQNYYVSEKENVCVVCGADESYIRKNIIPREYRKYVCLSVYCRSMSYAISVLCNWVYNSMIVKLNVIWSDRRLKKQRSEPLCHPRGLGNTLLLTALHRFAVKTAEFWYVCSSIYYHCFQALSVAAEGTQVTRRAADVRSMSSEKQSPWQRAQEISACTM